MKGKVFSVNISKRKGEPKRPVEEAILLKDFGLLGDVHAGLDEKKQVSLLSWERMQEKNFCHKKANLKVRPGDFAENITTSSIDLSKIKIGERLKIGDAIIEVSQIGKKCHLHCEIYKRLGNCIMPKEGIFAKVIKGGKVRAGDLIEVIEDD